mgnify:CR=1 FL=1
MDYDPRSKPPFSLMGCLVWGIIACICVLASAVLGLFASSLLASFTKQDQLVVLLFSGILAAFVPSWAFNVGLTWMRSKWNRRARFMDTWLGTALMVNVGLVLMFIIVLPGPTSHALTKYGEWPFSKRMASFLQLDEKHPAFDTGRKLVHGLSSFLEEEHKGSMTAMAKVEHMPKKASKSIGTSAKPAGEKTKPVSAGGNDTGTEPVEARPKPRIRDTEPPEALPPVRKSVPEVLPPIKRRAVERTIPLVRKAPVVRERMVSANTNWPTAKAIRIRYQRVAGSPPVIPIELGGQRMKILLDTGASFLTLSKRVVERLKITPPADAPSMTLKTANGEILTRVGLLPKLKLGSYVLRRVAFVVCDACADHSRGLIGLLGMNVVGRFLMTVDQKNGFVYFRPHANQKDQASDIRPFISYDKLRARTTRYFIVRRTFKLNGIIKNRATLGVRNLKLKLVYLQKKRKVGVRYFKVPPLRAGQARRFAFKDSPAPKFRHFRLEVVQGEWSVPAALKNFSNP